MKNYDTVEEYIADQGELQQKRIAEMISIIEDSVDFVEKKINYGIIALAFIKGGKRDQQVMLAAYKKHISFYPQPDTIEEFRHQLNGYKVLTGTVQFDINKELPRDLISKMTVFKYNKVRNEN